MIADVWICFLNNSSTEMCGHMCVGEQKRVFHDDSSSVDLKKYGAKELIKVFLKQPDNVA